MASISKQVGDAFEAVAERKLELMRAIGVVEYFEKQNPSLVFGGPKRGWQRGEASGADFHGVLDARFYGRAFALETKSVDLDSEKPYLADERITPKQWAHLDSVWRANRCAFLAVQFRAAARPWFTAVIPWGIVTWSIAKTRHRLIPEDARPFVVPTEVHLFEHLLDDRKICVPQLVARQPR